jgi:hypothetical protein
MRLPFLVSFLASLALAQSAYVPGSASCPSGQIGTWVSVAGAPAGFTLVHLSCLTLDSSVTLDTTTNPPTVRAIQKSSVAGVLGVCVDQSVAPNVITCNPGVTVAKGTTLIVFAAQTSNSVGVTINGVGAFHRDGGGFSSSDVLQGGLPTLFSFDGTVWREPYARLQAGGSGSLSVDYSQNPPVVDTVSSAVPCITCSNTWTGANDFSHASVFKTP